MTPLVVALVAKAGHGKTACAKAAVDTFGARVESFAGPLKKLAKRIWRLDDKFMYGTQADKMTPLAITYPIPPDGPDQITTWHHTTARGLMQDLGTWLRDELYKDVWVETAIRRIQANPAPLIVIDDLRYENEAELLYTRSEEFGYNVRFVHLVCDDAPVNSFDAHPSESAVPNIGGAWGDVALHWSQTHPQGYLADSFVRVLRDFGAKRCGLCNDTGVKWTVGPGTAIKVSCSCEDKSW